VGACDFEHASRSVERQGKQCFGGLTGKFLKPNLIDGPIVNTSEWHSHLAAQNGKQVFFGDVSQLSQHFAQFYAFPLLSEQSSAKLDKIDQPIFQEQVTQAPAMFHELRRGGEDMGGLLPFHLFARTLRDEELL